MEYVIKMCSDYTIKQHNVNKHFDYTVAKRWILKIANTAWQVCVLDL